MRLATHMIGILICFILFGLGVYTDKITAKKIKIYIEILAQGTVEINYFEYLKLLCASQTECNNPTLIPLYSYKSNWTVLENKFENTDCSSYECIMDLTTSIKVDINLDQDFNKTYSNSTDFLAFVAGARRVIPKGSGVIVPPYFNSFRDILENYDVFYVDKDDGNLSLGGRSLAGIFTSRMQLLLDANYAKLAPLSSGLLEQHMRILFSKLTKEDFYSVRKAYPK
ncbi:hypothetical protein OAM99_04785, partial [Planktomarina sp.]|nr:hypothetical protein [Planktomarina sp.]